MSSLPRPVALVTGAAVRLGRALALRLAREGHDLVLHHRRAPDEALARTLRECEDLGSSVLAVRADLGESAGPGAVVRAGLDRFGRLDLLVGSAACFPSTPTLAEAAAAWDGILAVNLKAPFLLAAEAAGALGEAGGSMVFLADIYAGFPRKGYLPYSVSKAGLVALTRGLAVDLAPRVRVNAVAPGFILPPPEGFEPHREAELLGRIPLARSGTEDDIVEAVLYLARAPYVTGQVLAVDGGRTLTLG